MDRIKVNGIELYYEIHGVGEPLILLNGLGYATWMWYEQIDELAKHFKVITFDQRGVGYSDKPDEEYTIEIFADDVASLLQKLGIEKAHILGASQGGFVAQEFALKYPEMTDKLILCCTSFGGPNMIPIPEETLKIMMAGGGDDKTIEDLKNATSSSLCESKIQERMNIVEKILEEKMKKPQPKYAYQRQLMAGASFNIESRIHNVTAETLILSGDGDRVVPYRNSYMLQEKIPQSRVEIIKDGGHVFFMECPDETNVLIVDFLKGIET